MSRFVVLAAGRSDTAAMVLVVMVEIELDRRASWAPVIAARMTVPCPCSPVCHGAYPSAPPGAPRYGRTHGGSPPARCGVLCGTLHSLRRHAALPHCVARCTHSPGTLQVLSGNADDVAAYWARGTAYDRLGYTAEAVADYSAVLLLDPDHFNAAYARAGACASAARFLVRSVCAGYPSFEPRPLPPSLRIVLPARYPCPPPQRATTVRAVSRRRSTTTRSRWQRTQWRAARRVAPRAGAGAVRVHVGVEGTEVANE